MDQKSFKDDRSNGINGHIESTLYYKNLQRFSMFFFVLVTNYYSAFENLSMPMLSTCASVKSVIQANWLSKNLQTPICPSLPNQHV